jgi:hypothetical protein
VLARPAVGVTLTEAVRAYYGDADLMRRLLRVEGRGDSWDETARSVLGREAQRAAGAAAPGRASAPGG